MNGTTHDDQPQTSHEKVFVPESERHQHPLGHDYETVGELAAARGEELLHALDRLARDADFMRIQSGVIEHQREVIEIVVNELNATLSTTFVEGSPEWHQQQYAIALIAKITSTRAYQDSGWLDQAKERGI